MAVVLMNFLELSEVEPFSLVCIYLRNLPEIEKVVIKYGVISVSKI